MSNFIAIDAFEVLDILVNNTGYRGGSDRINNAHCNAHEIRRQDPKKASEIARCLRGNIKGWSEISGAHPDNIELLARHLDGTNRA